MRRFVPIVIAGCFSGSPSTPPSQSPPAPPPPAKHGAVRCPPESLLQKTEWSARCLRRDTQQPHGPSVFRDENQRLLSESNFSNGEKDGDQRLYYPNGGKLAVEEHWQAGKRIGTWRYFYPSGAPSHERDFADNKEAAHRAFDDRGKPRTLAVIAKGGCTTDADCTNGPGHLQDDGCCSAENDCGAPWPKLAYAQLEARCAGFYCGPPQPSSSCMGILGTRIGCQQGACVRVRVP